MFEAPNRIADLIVEFVDGYATPPKTKATGLTPVPHSALALSSTELSVLLGRITAVVFSRSG